MYDYCENVKVERRTDGILVVTLDNPPTNAFDDPMHDQLRRLLEDVNHDKQTKVILLTGAGEKAFSAGGDIQHMRDLLDQPRQTLEAFVEARRLLNALLRLEKPLITRLNGHAIGLGATIALFSDLCYAVETARIADPHVAVGYAAGDGGALIWPQLIGYMRAREYLLTGDPILARDAAELGLINQAVPMADLDDIAYGMAERLAKGATVAINLTKQAINLPLRRQFEGMVDASVFFEAISAMSDDHREAVMAFLEKRPPQFTGN
ncbi:enoyl-CoA hydratase/isomerase family protein [Novosphingobium cyanobacteriorum]|uniref:Enoyl-CoA hydratase-related protein n=1 Tax=Novosphingobium cyanobacteriorum TaxID=3024215 RepID=A0ABT6CLW0_9SPHN|nr:enoyl-CoA hydratase-related protein [Novosphingobium cyanobacteriorum]MDF8334903.1 enoyl-CoA hydratase-related protein [Novosphingobium cyanobacteriorum]